MTDFDKIFNIVKCNRLAKELLNSGMSVSDIKELWRV